MSNMTYIRFENTSADLEDCLEHINDDLSDAEADARERLINLCRSILDEYRPPKSDFTAAARLRRRLE